MKSYSEGMTPEEVCQSLHYQYCSGAVWNERNPMITTPAMAKAITEVLEADHRDGWCWNRTGRPLEKHPPGTI